MELHTLGVDGGYTQKDVTEVAKVFTGWTIEEPRRGVGFTFNERRHEPGPKIVMGQTIPENGEQEGLDVLHRLATSPATAHHLSQQLAERFVSDTRLPRWWTAWRRPTCIRMATYARYYAPCLLHRSSGPARRIAPR